MVLAAKLLVVRRRLPPPIASYEHGAWMQAAAEQWRYRAEASPVHQFAATISTQ